jgi:uncharacterized protein
MNRSLSLLAILGTLLTASAIFAQSPRVVMNLSKSPRARLQNIPADAVRLGDGFWKERRRVTIENSIPTLLQLLEEHGIVDNFRRLSGKVDTPRRGPLFTDSDLYKWMEAAAYVLQQENRPELRAKMDELIGLIVAAQEPSGYLNTYYVEDRKQRQFQEMNGSHELYCLGHLLQAAIAYQRATGDRKLLDAGIKFADYLARDFGPTKQPLLAGHPELELALVELYRTTGERKYLDLAGYLLRGDGDRLKLRTAEMVALFSGKPFTSRTQLEGHAVRAMYACSGAADYYLETGDDAYAKTLERLWRDMVGSKMYITGGVGSRAVNEAFGEPYELPNAQAYTESCAAIGNFFWNWRMLAMSGEARFTDVMERALYNGINAGLSVDGALYCYRNPLALSGTATGKIRNPWYHTTCCPTNLQRLLASLPGYFYSSSKEGVWIHFYHNNELNTRLAGGLDLKLNQATDYPIDDRVQVTVTPSKPQEFTVFLRIPSWTRQAHASINGELIKTEISPGSYLALRRVWNAGDRILLSFEMDPQVVAPNPLMRDSYARVAIQRGPIVYCAEQVDQPEGVTLRNMMLRIHDDPAKIFRPEYKPNLLGGVMVLHHKAEAYEQDLTAEPLYQSWTREDFRAAKPVDMMLIPYYAFAHREPSAMEVWFPVR